MSRRRYWLQRLNPARATAPRQVLTLFIMTLAIWALSPHDSVGADNPAYVFSTADKNFLSRFALTALPELPGAPDNLVADNVEAAELGQQLFFDTRLSANQQVSCATCHRPEKFFTDGLTQSTGLGVTRRNSPSLPGAIYGEWFYWDGRKDSLWSQALTPLEHPDEHGLSRLQVVQLLLSEYGEAYAAVFGNMQDAEQLNSRLSAYAVPASPLGDDTAKNNWSQISNEDQQSINRIFSNSGKLLMAYQRRLALSPSRFDQFLQTLLEDQSTPASLSAIFSEDEVQGMRIFMGTGNCASCHNGPMFSNLEFHNIGAPEADKTDVDLGRFDAIEQLLNDEFTCLSQWSDAQPGDCEEMNFLKRIGPELVGAFKTPSLRNVAETAPYMQQGQMLTLKDVVAHYNKPTPPFFDREQHPNRPHFDILPLNLDEQQQSQLIAFLKTLTSDISKLNRKWWTAPTPKPAG